MSVWAHHDDRGQAVGDGGEPRTPIDQHPPEAAADQCQFGLTEMTVARQLGTGASPARQLISTRLRLGTCQ